MKLPPLKGLTNKQLLLLSQKLDKRHPGLRATARAFKADVAAEGPAHKLTKREQELQNARITGHQRGFDEARDRYERKAKESAEAFKAQRAALHLETLKAIRDLASAYGQMMGEVARAMQSEKDQL